MEYKFSIIHTFGNLCLLNETSGGEKKDKRERKLFKIFTFSWVNVAIENQGSPQCDCAITTLVCNTRVIRYTFND